MDSDAGGRRARALDSLLAGLQSGMLGALAMLVWLSVTSVYYRRTFWMVPNLLASTFHGEIALRRDFASTTFSGIALHLLIYALLGAIFGLLVQDRTTRLRIALLGIIWSIAWYYLAFGSLWKSINPLVPLYIIERPMLVGHLIYGGLLGRVPLYFRSLREAGMRIAPVLLACLLGTCSRPPEAPAPKSAQPPKITQFYANRAEVGPRERVLICYGVESAREVKLTPPVEELKPVFNRCFEVRPEATTEYTLTAVGEDGREATASLTIRRVARARAQSADPGTPAAAESPVIVGMFTANPAGIAPGASSSLCYQVENATAVRVVPAAVQLGAALRGCFYVTPRQTTTYTLTAERGGESASKQVTVTVR